MAPAILRFRGGDRSLRANRPVGPGLRRLHVAVCAVVPEKAERLQRVPLNMVCYGSFAHIQSFLAALEALPQRVWLNDLALQAPGEDGEAVRCELAMAVFVDDFGNLD